MADDHDERAERGLLALLLTDTQAVPEIMRQRLWSNDFIDLRHRAIWLAAVGLYERNEPIDLLTVAEETKRRDDIDAVAPSYLSTLVHNCLLYSIRDIPFMAQSLLPAAARAKRGPGTVSELLNDIMQERDER